MKHEWQDVFQRTAMFADIKTYIFYHLFDTYIIDYSMASATGMFNLETLDWDVEALELLGISKEMLPEIVPTTYVMKGMKKRYATLMGLNEDTPLSLVLAMVCFLIWVSIVLAKEKLLSLSVHLVRFEL